MTDLALLPGNPEAFFALESPYDRRDLKRAYGKAIRIYKPETHPNEFQLVRDAYELLEKRLRYGQQQKQREEASDAWATSQPAQDHPTDSGPQDSATSFPNQKSEPKRLSLRQLAVIDPAAALGQLQSKQLRSPPDYFLAAVLEDAASGKATAKYLGHLIKGLAAFPTDQGLTALTTEYLRTEVPDAMASKVVVYVADQLRSPLFYMLTESLWIRLASLVSFEELDGLLKTCERQIPQTDLTTRAIFSIRLLKTVIWIAPTEWTDERLREIETNFADVDTSVTAEIELLLEIQQVRNMPTTDTDPVRKKLLEAVRYACQDGDISSIGNATSILAELSQDAAAIAKSFPMSLSPKEDQDDVAWISLVYRVVYQLESYVMPGEELPQDRIATQTAHLLNDLQTNFETVVRGVERARSRYKQLPLIVWMIVGGIMGTIPLIVISFAVFGEHQGGAIICLIGIILLVVGLPISFYIWLFPRYLQPRMERRQSRWLSEDYAKHWRSRLFRYVRNNHETMEVIAMRINHVAAQMKKTDLADTVGHFISHDSGLYILAAIQKVAR